MPLVMMSDVVPEELEWLWPGRILFGKLNMLDGDGGLGKSTLMLDLAARLSTGQPLPDGTRHQPTGTLLLMAEDGAGDTILPRLANAGADMARIGLLQTITDPEDNAEVMPTLPDDLWHIENAIVAVGARLLVIDPLLGYIGDTVNEYRDKEMRRAMMPIIAMAQRLRIAVVGLRHVTKAVAGNAKHRGLGAVTLTNLARSVLFAATDPDIPECNILAQSKTNLGPLVASLRYRLENCDNKQPRIAWEGVSQHTADSLNAQGSTPQERSELAEAEEFLRDALAGGALLVTAVKRQARDANIAEMTLRRAKMSLRVISRKAHTQDGQWTWELPPAPASVEDAHSSMSPTLSALNTLSIFPSYSEDAQGVQDNQDADKRALNTFDTPESIPKAATAGGGYQCAVCGADILYARAGMPLLCATHRDWFIMRSLTAD